MEVTLPRRLVVTSKGSFLAIVCRQAGVFDFGGYKTFRKKITALYFHKRYHVNKKMAKKWFFVNLGGIFRRKPTKPPISFCKPSAYVS